MRAKLLVMGVLCAVGSALAQSPTIAAEGPTTFCAGGNVTLKATNGPGYQWYKNNIAIGGATSQSYIASQSGNYYVRYSGLSLNSNIISVTVNANPKANTTPSGNVSICQGTVLKITASPAGTGGSYLWSTGATTQTIYVSTGGSYTVTVTNAAGCSATSAPVAVEIVPLPATPTITAMGKVSFCSGGSVELRSSSATGNRWYRNNVLISGATSQSLFATASGSYTVRVLSGSCLSAPSLAKTVTVRALPVATTTPDDTVKICEGATTLITASYAGAYGSYLWSNGDTKRSVKVGEGTYTVTLTNQYGCKATSAPVTVIESPEKPLISSSCGSYSMCEGDKITLGCSVEGSAYLWSTGATTDEIVIDSPGKYQVQVWDVNGCTNTSDTIEVIQNPNPYVNAGSDQTIYIGYGSSSANLDAAVLGHGPFDFNWNTHQTTQSITVSPVVTSSYAVNVVDSNGCRNSDTVAVFVEDVTCGNNDDKIMICHTNSDGELTTICVSPKAIQNHLDHGDQLGACSGDQRVKPVETEGGSVISNSPVVFPNPFSDAATINYNVKEDSQVLIEVFDVLGQKVCTLVNENKRKGSYNATIEASILHSSDELFFLKISCGENSSITRFVRNSNK